jgi:hypothetical protein
VSTVTKAFSICKGVVLVQPQTGTIDKVNLILRPYKQPFPGLNVKYFIYRGLRKSDFFTTEPAPNITTGTSDFIIKINEYFDAFYTGELKDAAGNVISKPLFTAKFIGYDPTISDTKLLSDIFFKNSVIGASSETDAFELPMIDMGKSLGRFAEGDCGIDVVLNYGDYKKEFNDGEFVFDLAYARKAEAIITLTGTIEAEKKLQREQITQFIDIAAFYGLYSKDGKIIVRYRRNQNRKNRD